HRPDDGEGGVVGIQDRSLGSLQLVFSDELQKLGIQLLPALLLPGLKSVRKATPADVLDEDVLLFRGGSTSLRLDVPEGSDCCEVVLGLGDVAAVEDLLTGLNAEV
ncbi:MAG: hypothetical protein KAJ42_10190, partial [Gemmatimonadetes bacterium]|nr:hypothetical protein [Gemmatimonadota bacterium]